MFRFSAAFSLLADQWEYQWILGESDEADKKQAPTSQAKQPTAEGKKLYSSTTSARAHSREKFAREKASQPQAPSAAADTDRSFDTLSSYSQEMQRQARERQLERAADAQSLHVLQAATGKNHKHKQVAKLEDRKSLAVLEAAHAKLKKEKKWQKAQAQAIAAAFTGASGASGVSVGVTDGKNDGKRFSSTTDEEGWTLIGPSSTDFCKKLDSKGTTISSQHPSPSPAITAPQSLPENYIKPRKLFSRTSGIAQDSLSFSQSAERALRHDFESDPFGSLLMRDAEQHEARLKKSLQKSSRPSQADSVYRLFDELQLRDEQVGGNKPVGVASSGHSATEQSPTGSAVNATPGSSRSDEGGAELVRGGVQSQTAGWEHDEEDFVIVDDSPTSTLGSEEEDDWLMV